MDYEHCRDCADYFRYIEYKRQWVIKIESINLEDDSDLKDIITIYYQCKKIFPEFIVHFRLDGCIITEPHFNFLCFEQIRWIDDYINVDIAFTSHYPVSNYYIYHKIHDVNSWTAYNFE